jgi:hypothetical protein
VAWARQIHIPEAEAQYLIYVAEPTDLELEHHIWHDEPGQVVAAERYILRYDHI